MRVTENLRADCAYDEMEDTGVDSLIAYKDALEEIVNRIDAIMLANNGEPKAVTYRDEREISDMSAADVCGALYSMGFGEVPTGEPPAPCEKILVTPEGRDGIWIPDRDSLVAWLEAYPDEIHCFVGSGSTVLIGADWDREQVAVAVREAESVGLLTGEAAEQNIGHALAVIDAKRGLLMFDVGPVDDWLEPA